MAREGARRHPISFISALEGNERGGNAAKREHDPSEGHQH